jgi:hypothetical protein
MFYQHKGRITRLYISMDASKDAEVRIGVVLWEWVSVNCRDHEVTLLRRGILVTAEATLFNHSGSCRRSVLNRKAS